MAEKSKQMSEYRCDILIQASAFLKTETATLLQGYLECKNFKLRFAQDVFPLRNPFTFLDSLAILVQDTR